MNKYDALVIGGGLSGLVSARTILDRDKSLSVAIVEANDELGGRISSIKIPQTNEDVEVGADLVHATNSHIQRLLMDMGLSTRPVVASGNTILHVTRHPVVGSGPSAVSWLGYLELLYVVAKLDKISSQICPLDPYAGPYGLHYDAKTFSSWLEENTWIRCVRHYITAVCRVIFAAEPSQLSTLYVCLVARSVGGFSNIVWPSKATIDGGPSELVSRLQKNVRESGVDIFTSSTVSHITHSEHEVTVMLEGGKCLQGRKVIICIPPAHQAKIKYSPPLPALKEACLRQFPMGRLTKFVILYDRPYWAEKGLSGGLLSSGGPIGHSGCEGIPITLTYTRIGQGGTCYLAGFLGGKLADEWATKSDADLSSQIVESLSTMMGPWVLQHRGIMVRQWTVSDRMLSGGVSYQTTGAMYAFPAVRIPVRNLHFGGTETALAGLGYMEGAVESGERVAFEVLLTLSPNSLLPEEIQVLEKYSIENLDGAPPPRHAVFRWTIIMPLTYLVIMYTAIKLRDRYSFCLIPFH